ncbi:26S proteasome non-ATPase regulatory subunit 6 [Trichoplax sp. H2]|uniref:26S proteasome non-ATPase regulatory subunit 6 n=1 Tax=Trichoplax adhaerens TaxID=10228 RepID=B3RI98_TRIAD|nr:hypothetical protein TRIADDRAFT_18564 [Trichoplax adhaerens]EDV28981.1 hypothetical protein TRIADDRAFT_18564 [Trichoplax adhaerens]RDD47207.1 26S proteasome non-ATPase regulatory subunit 6 [Trichoplax sp. H2]|eukprot:XP_002108183.1 hypothetical protein TRIADDRAFT_18564 [Trichoplax adhaerens]
MEEEGLSNIPNLQIARLKFLCTMPEYDMNQKGQAKEQLMKNIEAANMAPFYQEICREMKWEVDDKLLNKMKLTNQAELKRLSDALEDAEKNRGESEVRDIMLEKAEYLSKIGDKDGSLIALRQTYDKTMALGQKMDIIFHLIRIGFFYTDHDLIKRNIQKAESLLDEGGDWDRRNRLKVYRGLYALAIRDFKTTATSFLDTISTFTSYELMDYKQFVIYTVVASMISLERVDLKDKVVNGSEILEVLHELPKIKSFLNSLYYCNYDQFFVALGDIEQIMKFDRYTYLHYRYYVNEMKIRVYKQLLQSYKSLTLQYMANAFGVSTEYIDKELSRLIAAERLNCKINKVMGFVETNRPDSKNRQYQAIVKHGDALLNRMQKLSRIINV